LKGQVKGFIKGPSSVHCKTQQLLIYRVFIRKTCLSTNWHQSLRA